MKIYISLPISGHTCDDVEQRIGMAQVALEKYVEGLNAHNEFGDAREFVSRLKKEFDGAHVMNPVDLNDASISDQADENNYESGDAVNLLCEDLKTIIGHADAILLCDGFEDSRGCMLEAAAACLFGKKIFFLRNGKVHTMTSNALRMRLFDRSNALTHSCFDQIDLIGDLPF